MAETQIKTSFAVADRRLKFNEKPQNPTNRSNVRIVKQKEKEPENAK